jgi:hypothetical protein
MRFKTIIIAAAVFAVLLLALFFYVWLEVQQIKAPAGPIALGPISSSVRLNSSAGLFYNNSHAIAVYALIAYRLVNATNATFTLNTYTKNPIQKIYLMNVSTYCEACFGENALMTSLVSSLGAYGLINASGFKYVGLGNASSIPAGSIVIIPSGELPLPLANSTGATLFRMLNQGDTVIYAGRNLSNEIRYDGVTFAASPATSALLTSYNLSPTSFQTNPKVIFNPENLSFKGPAFQFAYGSDYGNVTYVNSRNGTLIAFPNYPQAAWSNASSMAGDIAKVIDSRFWIPQIGQGAGGFSTGATAIGAFGIFSNITTPSSNMPPAPSALAALVNASYSLVTVVVRNPRHSVTTQLSFRDRYAWNGIVNAPEMIGEGQVTSITVSATSKTSTSVQLHVDVYDQNMSQIVKSIRIGTGAVPSGSSPVVTPTFSLPSGYYILALKDFSNHYYAESVFFLANSTINPTLLDFKNGTFAFSVYSDGLPVSNSSYSISLDGAYSANGTVDNGTISYRVPHGVINYGSHAFRINVFGNSYTIPEQYVQTYLYIPSIDWEFAIAIVVVVLLNFILKPPTRDEYYVDVPEFPPLKKEKVGVPSASVLGVFDKINYYYHWKYMPLSVDEVRLGINSNIKINNMPVSVTTQNTDAVLSQLAAKGDLLGALGYYAPKAWVDASKHDVEYLLVFRKLRDYCVVHSILFTDIDMEPDVDLTVTKEGKQGSVFIYSAGSKPKKVLMSSESRSFLVFLDETRKQEFVNELYASFGAEAETLKLGIDYNYLKLIDCDHLDQMTL